MTRSEPSHAPERRGGSRRRRLMLLAPLTALTVAGCGASTEQAAATEAALRFTARASQDAAAACADLAPRTLETLERTAELPCPDALSEEELPEGDVATRTERAGSSAMVVLDTQTVFLARFDAGWKVVAAGCSRAPDDPESAPYTCDIEGG